MRMKLILLCLVEFVIGGKNTKSLIGTVAKQGEFPFAVGLHDEVQPITQKGVFCSGALVKLDMVMTAGHCFWAGNMKKNVTINKYFAIMGVVDIRNKNDPLYQTRNIVDYKLTEWFTNVTMQNDTAAAFLDKPYEITETVGLAKIVSGDPDKFKAAWHDIVEKKEKCRGIGWGYTYADPPNNKTKVVSYQLKYITLLPWSDEKCSKKVFGFKTYGLCGKGLVATVSVDPDDSLARGDSGGPLLCGEYVYGTLVGGDDTHKTIINMFFLFFPFLEYFGIEGTNVSTEASTSVSTQKLSNTYTIISLTIFLNSYDKYTIK